MLRVAASRLGPLAIRLRKGPIMFNPEPTYCGGSVTTLVTKKSVGFAPEVNLRELVTCTPLPSVNKTSPEVKNRGISAPKILKKLHLH